MRLFKKSGKNDSSNRELLCLRLLGISKNVKIAHVPGLRCNARPTGKSCGQRRSHHLLWKLGGLFYHSSKQKVTSPQSSTFFSLWKACMKKYCTSDCKKCIPSSWSASRGNRLP